jgi:hypothetical protein
VDHVFTRHLSQPSQDTLEDEPPLLSCVLGETAEPAADGSAVNELEGEVDGVL